MYILIIILNNVPSNITLNYIIHIFFKKISFGIINSSNKKIGLENVQKKKKKKKKK